MKNKRHYLMVLLAALSMASAGAQDFYDITENYIKNHDFTANVDYDIDAAEDNVKNGTLNTPQGWTLIDGAKSTLAVAATFRYGTKATFVNKNIPALGPDSTADGACLTLCAAYGNFMGFGQKVKMPAGNYKLLVTYYNCNPDAETVVSNMCGWFVSSDDNVLSETITFGFSEWRTDTIAFTLDDASSGQLRIGIKCTGATTKNAMLAVDNVRLLRDTPYGLQDDLVPAPEVVTDTRFARGATMAFGRIKSFKGESIEECGFCWGETPEPTIDDNATTDYLSNSGTIYWMQGLKPATIYYMRAYAKNSYGKVGYGEVIKFCTVPKGNVSYWYNNGGDDAANARVNTAAQEACDIFNNLTEIVKHYSIGYSAGTPTADCYYADEPWMNMGANASYQRTGTIMHEMQHGLGLIPYSTQWNKNILRASLDGDGRGTGLWLGDRVSAFLDFWDNTSGSHLNGDYQHMWPYGINGASEDNGKKELYYANAMIGQALGEDGLEHRSNTFAEPCYIFTQDDNTKYYLKCEDADRGLYDSYLVPTATGTLRWRGMTAAEAQQNDSAAWHITFTPANQYYQLRNAATGQYLTYSGGFKTMERAATTASDNFHLMRGRIDVGSGSDAKRGYWLIRPTGNLTPNVLQANAGGTIGSAIFDISNTATKQRWLILTAEETDAVEKAAVESLRSNFMDILANIKELLKVPHTQLKAGTDQTYEATIADLEQQAQSATQPYVLLGLQAVASKEMMTFLSNVHATDENKPFDLTFLMTAPGMDSTDGWVGTKPTLNYSCAEFYQTTFDLWQNVSDLPGGQYKVRVQGFQRPGTTANAYANYTAGKDNITSYLYAGTTTNATKLADISADAQNTKVGKGNESTVGGSFYVPNNMQAASAYFDKGLYENSVDATVDTDGGSLRIGLRCTSAQDYYWTIFDNFRLHFFGKPVTTNEGDVNGDGTVDVADISSIIDIMAGNVGADLVSAHAADINGDGTVDVADIATVISIMAEK